MTASAASARIVVGTDGSEPAGRAVLRWAADEARRRGAVLEVVHVWLPPYPIDPKDLFEDETGARTRPEGCWRTR